MNLTTRQRIAFEHPCTRAKDTLNDRFIHRGPSWSTILSLNK